MPSSELNIHCIIGMAAISSEELQDAWQKVKAMTILPEVRSRLLDASYL